LEERESGPSKEQTEVQEEEQKEEQTNVQKEEQPNVAVSVAAPCPPVYLDGYENKD
jgi:hypothetical protein